MRQLRVGFFWGTLLCALPVTAQSIAVDAIDDAAPEAPPEAPIEPPQAPPAPVLVAPKPLSTPLSYPPGGKGNQEIVLELVIESDGSVSQAVAVTQIAPFDGAAERAARSWKFSPATRDGQPVAARIRFLVTFEQHQEEPPAAERAGPSAPPPAEEEHLPPAQEASAPLEVVVVGERQALRHSMGRADIKEMPGAFGDPYRAIEALPGVTPIVSGLPYFYVRGAPPGNVGYFFDGIPVPVLYHFAAGPGVFHPSFVEQVDLYAGAYPARYGRYAGGIVSGELAPPKYDFRGEASIRIIDSGGMIEAPFDEGRGSVMAGGRFSYTGLVISLLVPEITLTYWDYQTRASYQLDADDTVEVLWFGSGDYVSEEQELEDGTTETNTIVDLGFHRLDLRWHRALEKGEMRHALMLGLDRTRLAEGEVRFINRMVGARSDATEQLRPGLQLRTGIDALYERLDQRISNSIDDQEEVDEPDPTGGAPPAPGMGGGPSEPIGEPVEDPDEGDPNEVLSFSLGRDDFVIGAYADLVIDVNSRLQVVPGLRSDLFVSEKDVALGVDPRISARYTLRDGLSISHGLGLVHQMPSFVVPIPGIKPSLRGGLQRALQYSAGVDWSLPYEISSSFVLFQNLFFNMTDFLGIQQLSQTANEDEGDADLARRMHGRGYGFEVLLRRSLAQRIGGLLSYTYSRSQRMAGRLAGPATTERRHVLNVALSYDLGSGWRIGGRALVYSGIPARVAYIEAAQDPPRTPPFWRLDGRIQKRWVIGKGPAYVGLILEMLNATLNKEVLDRSCHAFACADEEIGPVTIPSIGAEGAF